MVAYSAWFVRPDGRAEWRETNVDSRIMPGVNTQAIGCAQDHGPRLRSRSILLAVLAFRQCVDNFRGGGSSAMHFDYLAEEDDALAVDQEC